MNSYDPTVEQWINIGLTVVIAIAVIAQAYFTHKQARLLEKSERRARDRDRPTVLITALSRSVLRTEPSGDVTTKSYEGFTVANAGFRDIEITSFAFEVGRMANNGDNAPATAVITFRPVMQDGEDTISTMSLPHRLRHGESFKVLYDAAKLVEESTKLGGEMPVRMRPYCKDSLGNKHMLDLWIAYKEVNMAALFDAPSPGRISEEEWKQLSRAKKKRYSSWTQRSVGA